MSVFKYLNVRVLSWIFVMHFYKFDHLPAMCPKRVQAPIGLRAHRNLMRSGRVCERHVPLGNICTSHLLRVRRQRRLPRRRWRWQAPAAAALPLTFSLTLKAFLNRRNSYHSVELLPTGGPVAEFVVHGDPVLVLFAVVPLAEYAFLGPRLTFAPLAGMAGRQFI